MVAFFCRFCLNDKKLLPWAELPENITFQGKRQKKSAMGRSVPKRWAQVDFTDASVWIATSFRPRPRMHKHANVWWSMQLHELCACALHESRRISPAGPRIRGGEQQFLGRQTDAPVK